MPRKLNAEYILQTMKKDVLRGLEVVFLTGEQFGVSDQHPDGLDNRKIREVKPGIFVAGVANYRGWSAPGRLYCLKCKSPLIGIPREIMIHNCCDLCGSNLYDADNAERLDLLGFEIYRHRATRYMRLAVRHFRDMIDGAERILPRGGMVKGFEKDHTYSVRDGFDNAIDEFVVSSPSNIRVIRTADNLAKGKKSDCTVDDLLEGYDAFVSLHPEWRELVARSDESEETFVYD